MRARLLQFWRWKVEDKATRLVLGALCAVSATTLLLISPLSIMAIFLSYGIPPCTDDSAAIDAQLWFAFVCFFSAVSFAIAAANGRVAWAMIATSLTATAFAVLLSVWVYNDRIQASCKAWTLEEALVQCRAHPAHYRIETHPGQNGSSAYRTLRLVAPGDTDAAWRCLESWSNHAAEGADPTIDESVYEQHRRRVTRVGTDEGQK